MKYYGENVQYIFLFNESTLCNNKRQDQGVLLLSFFVGGCGELLYVAKMSSLTCLYNSLNRRSQERDYCVL